MSLAIANRTTGDLITATIWNNDLVASINGLDATTSTITTTGAQGALSLPSGFGDLVIFANNATLLTINGIGVGSDGQQLTIYSIGAGQVDLSNQSGSASAATNRIVNGVTGTISLAAGTGRVVLEYDNTAQRWRVLAHEQGAWITPTFAAGNFTAGGAQTWTVGPGDVQAYAYKLTGRTLQVNVVLASTTVGGTPNAQLKAAIPGGFTAAKAAYAWARVFDNSSSVALHGFVNAAAAAAVIDIYSEISAATSWTASTDNTTVSFLITIEVS